MSTTEVNVYGLGFVGLTLAVTLAEDPELRVLGVETNREKLDSLLGGTVPFFEVGLQEAYLKVYNNLNLCNFPVAANFHIICVGTPPTDTLHDLDTLVEEIVNVCRPGDTIIIRSTVPLGTTKRYAETYSPAIRWAFCPERTLAGKALEELRTLPQIVGGDDSAAILFGRMTRVVKVSSTTTAEMIKLVSNCWRSYLFAFANQLAIDADIWKVDVYEVLEAGKDSYPRFDIPNPGFSQGPCLTKDPTIYGKGFVGLHLFEKAASVNISSFCYNLWKLAGNTRIHQDVGLLGASFKGNPPTSDTRNSPLSELKRVFDITPAYWDPSVKGSLTYDQVWADKDLVIIGTDLAKRLEMRPMLHMLKPGGMVIDFWNTWPDLHDPRYKVIGKP